MDLVIHIEPCEEPCENTMESCTILKKVNPGKTSLPKKFKTPFHYLGIIKDLFLSLEFLQGLFNPRSRAIGPVEGDGLNYVGHGLNSGSPPGEFLL